MTLTRLAGAVEHWFLLPVLLVGAAGWMAYVQHDPFFWDTVQLGSKHAHFFYENGLRWAALPEEIDSGHPPVFGYYLAWAWRLFGKTLAVSHWAMFPFVAGVVMLLFRLGTRLGGSPWYGAGLVLLAAADPVLTTQSGLIGPDIALIFFFLLAVWALWEGRPRWVAVGVLGLCAISLRGMMTAAGLLLWQLSLLWLSGLLGSRHGRGKADAHPQAGAEGEASMGGGERRFERFGGGLLGCSFWPNKFGRYGAKLVWPLRGLLGFLPGFAFAAWFLWWHRQATGWTGFHAGSPWASAFEPVRGVTGVLRNIAIVGWRWADFGRLFEWIGLIAMWLALPGQGRWVVLRPWLLLLLYLLLFLSPSAIFYQNLSAHRYFLPSFVALHLLLWQGLCAVPWSNTRRCASAALVMLGLASGNFWRYPHGIAVGWDATLAHRPYHTLRSEAMDFIEKKGIPLERIGTAFPNRNTGEHLLLNGDQRLWAAFEPQANEYALISNVFNDVSPEDRAYLRQHRRLWWRGEQSSVWLELYGPD